MNCRSRAKKQHTKLTRAHTANSPAFSYEGKGWYANVGAGAGATAMYRFFNTRTGTHFYTTSAAERDSVLLNSPAYNYEGIAYYAWTTL